MFVSSTKTIDTLIAFHKRENHLTFSREFIECENQQLTGFFEHATGIKVNKHVGLSTNIGSYTKSTVSRLEQDLYVNHNWVPVTICWKSASGRVYETGDYDIDYQDVSFWMENMNILDIYKYMFPEAEVPFQLKHLSYALEVERLNTDCTVEMQVRAALISKEDALMNELDACIDRFNWNSEKEGRVDGVVYNWKRKKELEKIIYEINTGSAGPIFLKKFLQFLSKTEAFEKVVIS